MTRFLLLSLAVVLGYWLIRRIVRNFLEGLRPENRNVRGGGKGAKEIFPDVQDADFTDISDDKKSRRE